MTQTDLSKESVHDEVKQTTKDLISHENCDIEVGDYDGAVVLETVRPMSSGSQYEPNHVQTERQGEEFPDGVEIISDHLGNQMEMVELPVHVEPQAETDPFGNFPFGLSGGRLSGRGSSDDLLYSRDGAFFLLLIGV